MTKPSLSIIIEKQDSFFPGETLRGKVVLNLCESLEAKVVLLRFIGKVNWKFADGNDACLGRGNLFNNEITLVSPEEQKRENRILLDAGEYVFPFEFILPSKLPSSYQHKHYKKNHLETFIYYGIEAVIKKKFLKQDYKSQLEFRVAEVRSLDLVAQMKEKLEVKSEKQVTLLGMSYGFSVATISVPKCGYYLGETISPAVTIDHSSYTYHTGEIYIELVRETSYLLEGNKIASQAHLSLKKILIKERLDARTSYSWTDSISIPFDITPEIYVQDCLELKYCLRLTIELIRGKDISCSLPLVIVKSSAK